MKDDIIADKLDFYMLENVEINILSVNRVEMDAEALLTMF